MRVLIVIIFILSILSCSSNQKDKSVERIQFCKSITSASLNQELETYSQFLSEFDEGNHANDFIFIQFLDDKNSGIDLTFFSSPGFPEFLDSNLVLLKIENCQNVFIIEDITKKNGEVFYDKNRTSKKLNHLDSGHPYNDVTYNKRKWRYRIESDELFRLN